VVYFVGRPSLRSEPHTLEWRISLSSQLSKTSLHEQCHQLRFAISSSRLPLWLSKLYSLYHHDLLESFMIYTLGRATCAMYCSLGSAGRGPIMQTSSSIWRNPTFAHDALRSPSALISIPCYIILPSRLQNNPSCDHSASNSIQPVLLPGFH